MGERKEKRLILESRPLERLDAYLREQWPGLSRGAIQRLIADGYVRVDGKPVKPSHHPRAGEEVEIEFPLPKATALEPEAIPLDILFEDADLVVLNKPAGLVVHPACGHPEHTLVNALLHHCQGQLSGIGGVARPGIVHRLDRDTTGCLVAAKNDFAHLALTRQFASRNVQKTYHLIACGNLAPERGEVRAAIGRHCSHRKRMAVADGAGREARTSFRVLERFGLATWIEAQPHTGRTHQIRVHFHHLGHPLLGDPAYGARATQRLAQLTGIEPERLMLHAYEIGFDHPRSGEPLFIRAERPLDFERALRAFRALGTSSADPEPL